MMARLVKALFVIVLLVGGLGWLTYWSLDTCRPLDRLLGLSGCSGSVEIVGMSTLTRSTMSVPDQDGVSSLFGWARTADGLRAAMVRLDPVAGTEFGRYPLRMQNAFTNVHMAVHGKRALLSCTVERYCTETGQLGAIVSLSDGQQIAAFDDGPTYVRGVPGDPQPSEPFGPQAVLADGGNTVVSLDDDRALRLYRIDGTPIATLGERTDRFDQTVARFSISPSGRYVALLDKARGNGQGDRFYIWDGRTGVPLWTVSTGAGYRTVSYLTWSRDEAAVFAIRSQAGNTIIDRFLVRTGAFSSP
ncbi:hypothetical protein [Devosia sp. A369]